MKKKIILRKVFNNKKVIVTGHTGFKGSWLTFWLENLGAKVIGISNNLITSPSVFNILNIKKKITHKNLDIRNLKKTKEIFKKYQPDYVFHLAAQSLVKKSYKDPIYTFGTNSIGTLNVLESLREIRKKCVVILITSDKSYKNLELKRGYKENDILGGVDPYSASKGAAELIIKSYINSYFKNSKNILVGIARAGNVIGGGDWSSDRLVPDCVRSWSKNKRVLLRNPNSTRPWQHVFEAVGGYLFFASKLKINSKLHGEAFNFGPKHKKTYSVLMLIKLMKKYWKNVSWQIVKRAKIQHYESTLLKLNCNKAHKLLNWKSILNFNETIEMTTNWYRKFYTNRKNIKKFSLDQIKSYEKLMMERL
jgi:CDP-glucose 4,6-dehydratase